MVEKSIEKELGKTKERGKQRILTRKGSLDEK